MSETIARWAERFSVLFLGVCAVMVLTCWLRLMMSEPVMEETGYTYAQIEAKNKVIMANLTPPKKVYHTDKERLAAVVDLYMAGRE